MTKQTLTIHCHFFTVCEHDGKQYKVGENFPKGDNCNRCSCGPNGLVNCSDKYCKKEHCKFCTNMYNYRLSVNKPVVVLLSEHFLHNVPFNISLINNISQFFQLMHVRSVATYFPLFSNFFLSPQCEDFYHVIP